MATLLPTFDGLLADILADYQNKGGKLDKEAFIRLACLAAAVWGAYHHQGLREKNIFPDSCDYESLVHHGSVDGLTPKQDETEDEFRARVKEDEQNPPAGGNEQDYKTWAEEVSGVAAAFVFPLAQGDGTVDIVPVADAGITGSEVPSNSSRIGITTGADANNIIDAGAAFTTALAVRPGNLVENPAKRRSTTVSAVTSATELALADTIFKYPNESYIIYLQSAVITAVTPGKLIDAAGAFTDASYPAQKGDVVENLDTGLTSTIVSVDGAGAATLADDIFLTPLQRYVIRGTLAQVKKNIDQKRPVGASRCAVAAPAIQLESVTMNVSGDNVDRPQLRLDIAAYQNALEPGETLQRDRLTALAIQNGSTAQAVTVPAADVVPAAYTMIRPDVITVN